MFGKRKLLEEIENVHYDFDSLNFANYINKVLVSKITDRNLKHKLLKHLERYQRLCKQDVIKRKDKMFSLGENFYNALKLDNSFSKEDLNIISSALMYDNLINARFEKDIYNGKYDTNNKKVDLSYIDSKFQYPNLKITNKLTKTNQLCLGKKKTY